MNSWLKDHGEWLYRLAVILGLVALGFLNSRFASRDELTDLGKRVNAIETAIRVMVETNRVNDRQDESIRDHETRLRVLERPAK